MALIERLLRLKDDGAPMGDESSLFIPTHKFNGACMELVNGRQTVAQVKVGLGLRSTVDVSGFSDEQDFDALVALAPTGTSALATANKAMFLLGVTGIIHLGQFGQRPGKEYPGYVTPVQIRSKLGI